jgi:hypothetical protein
MRKKIFLETISIIGSGKPKEALRFFDLNTRLTIHDMNELTAVHSLDFFSSYSKM